ncbi:1-pyrroline-5-carboxylate dehydrogenase, partial [Bacillus sp. mrc49]
MVQPYKHEPFTNFKLEENDKAFQVALNEVANELGKKYPLIINGEKVFTDEVITSVNPANKEEVIGEVSK